MTNNQQNLERVIDMGFTPELFPVGTHMCYLYNDEDERRDAMAQFTKAGIAANEFVGYFADVETNDLVDSYLSKMGIRLPEEAQKARTLFKRARDVYCPDGYFTPEGMLGKLRTLHEDCHAQGIQDVRVTGEMAWALSPGIHGVDRLVEYESRLNLLMETNPFTVLCQYDVKRFDGATIFEILKVHPMMVVQGQVVRNPYYVSAREYLGSQGLPTEA